MARQLNFNLTPAFEKELWMLPGLRKIPINSDAVRIAVHEVVERMSLGNSRDIGPWLGAALRFPANPKSRFQNEDQLW